MIHPESILREFKGARLNEEAVAIEQVHFTKTDRAVNPKQVDPLRYFAGKIPVLVSAPHAVRHLRQKQIKVSDLYTGSIAYLLNKQLDCHALMAAKLYGGDPNYDHPCLYKKRIAEICQQNKIKFIIDIHGAARDHAFDVDLGTDGTKTLLGRMKIQETLERHFQRFGLTNVSKDFFPASNRNTVTNFVSRELEIPSIQIEINKMYRVPAQNPEAFHRLLGALVESIRELSTSRN